MTMNKREQRYVRQLAALHTDDLHPADYATLDALVAWATDMVRIWDRKEAGRVDAREARKHREAIRHPDAFSMADGYALVRARSGGLCELAGVKGRHGATLMHHVSGRGGDDPHNPDNLLHLCNDCHLYVHANPAHAREIGAMRSRLAIEQGEG